MRPAGDAAMSKGEPGYPAWRRWLRWLVLLVLACTVILYRALPIVLGPKVPVVSVKRSDIVQTVVASGRISVPTRIDVSSTVLGVVTALNAREGQKVRKGQVLIQIEDQEAVAYLAQAQGAVRQAEARLAQLRQTGSPVAEQGVRQAQANLELALRQYERNRVLRTEGFISQATLDEAKKNLHLAQSQLDTARLQLKGSRTGGDYQLAMAALEQAQAGLRAAQSRLRNTTINSPADGTILSRDIEAGNVAQPGKPLLTMQATGQTQVVLNVDEKDIAGLRVGDPAMIAADAFPADRFPGQVIYVAPAVDPQRGTVEVKVQASSPPPDLLADMTASVEIITGRHQGALVLPTEAVRRDADDRPWVLAVVAGKAQRRSIMTGLQGSGAVEILRGLKAGDRIISSTGRQIDPGERVRPQLQEQSHAF
jgi:HlyD family secretion protein